MLNAPFMKTVQTTGIDLCTVAILLLPDTFHPRTTCGRDPCLEQVIQLLLLHKVMYELD